MKDWSGVHFMAPVEVTYSDSGWLTVAFSVHDTWKKCAIDHMSLGIVATMQTCAHCVTQDISSVRIPKCT